MYVTTSRRPQDSFTSLQRLNTILDEAFNLGTVTSAWQPVCDVFEDKNAVKILAELPGVEPADVKISLENNVLTVRGEKKQRAEEKNERVHRYERSYGTFERSFSLPTTVDPEKIAADYAHGILTVTIPKAERAKPREIPVKVA